MKKYAIQKPKFFYCGGDYITLTHINDDLVHYVEHIHQGGWYIPIDSYTEELNLDIMKLIKKHFGDIDALQAPYFHEKKDIPELHEIVMPNDNYKSEFK